MVLPMIKYVELQVGCWDKDDHEKAYGDKDDN
ncbi:MAG: hypothetical protein ACJAS1_000561 [Oleiphilaceae bacterium]|jgi:hypothetical protein